MEKKKRRRKRRRIRRRRKRRRKTESRKEGRRKSDVQACRIALTDTIMDFLSKWSFLIIMEWAQI